MRWAAKITDTAKLPVEQRWILLGRVSRIAHELKSLRCRALRYASLDVITTLAAGVPLPTELDEEKEQLKDDPDLETLVKRSLREQAALEDGLAETTDASSNLENTEWFELESDKERLMPVRFDTESPIRPSSPGLLIVDSNGRATTQRTCERSTIRGTRDDPLVTPWRQTLATQLKEYLDFIEDERPSSFSTKDPKTGRRTQAGLTIHGPSTFPVSCSIIKASHILSLERHIQSLARFRAYIARSLSDVSAALDRREQRYVMRETNGDITMIMKSRGEGSPLVQAISADDKWPSEEDTWGLPQPKLPRRKLYGCYALSKDALSQEATNEAAIGISVWETPDVKPSPRGHKPVVW